MVASGTDITIEDSEIRNLPPNMGPNACKGLSLPPSRPLSVSLSLCLSVSLSLCVSISPSLTVCVCLSVGGIVVNSSTTAGVWLRSNSIETAKHGK